MVEAKNLHYEDKSVGQLSLLLDLNPFLLKGMWWSAYHAVQTSCSSKFLFLAPGASACPSTCYTLVHSRSLQQNFLQQSHAWRCTTKPMHCNIGSFVSFLQLASFSGGWAPFSVVSSLSHLWSLLHLAF